MLLLEEVETGGVTTGAALVVGLVSGVELEVLVGLGVLEVDDERELELEVVGLGTAAELLEVVGCATGVLLDVGVGVGVGEMTGGWMLLLEVTAGGSSGSGVDSPEHPPPFAHCWPGLHTLHALPRVHRVFALSQHTALDA